MSRLDFATNNHGVKVYKKFRYKDKYGLIPFSILIILLIIGILAYNIIGGKWVD